MKNIVVKKIQCLSESFRPEIDTQPLLTKTNQDKFLKFSKEKEIKLSTGKISENSEIFNLSKSSKGKELVSFKNTQEELSDILKSDLSTLKDYSNI